MLWLTQVGDVVAYWQEMCLLTNRRCDSLAGNFVTHWWEMLWTLARKCCDSLVGDVVTHWDRDAVTHWQEML